MIHNNYNSPLDLIFLSSLFESTQTLFWASFGLIDLENFELTGKQMTNLSLITNIHLILF